MIAVTSTFALQSTNPEQNSDEKILFVGFAAVSGNI